MFHGHLDYFQKPPLGGRPNTKPGDHGTPNAHNRWFILFYHVWGPTWIEIHWNSIWLRARSHMTSHYTWGPVTTLHDFGGVLGRPLDTFFGALTISWSRLLARVCGDPNKSMPNSPRLVPSIHTKLLVCHWLSLAPRILVEIFMELIKQLTPNIIRPNYFPTRESCGLAIDMCPLDGYKIHECKFLKDCKNHGNNTMWSPWCLSWYIFSKPKN